MANDQQTIDPLYQPNDGDNLNGLKDDKHELKAKEIQGKDDIE